MAKVLCRLVGNGVLGDTYRVNFPTYTMYAKDINSRLAVIEIPDADVPPNLPAPPFNPPWIEDGPIDVIRLVGASIMPFTELIRHRYREGFSDWDAAAGGGV